MAKQAGDGAHVGGYLNWDLPDPAGLTVAQVRPIRDEIAARVSALLSGLGVQPAGG